MLFLPMIEAHREWAGGSKYLWDRIDEQLSILSKDGPIPEEGTLAEKAEELWRRFWIVLACWDLQFEDWLPYFKLTCE